MTNDERIALRALADSSDAHWWALSPLPPPETVRRLLDALDAAEAERESLRAELGRVCGALGGDAYWMDPPDGGSVSIAEQVERASVAGRNYETAAYENMCPNCVTPWKCNGPHELAPRPSTADLDARDQHGLRWPHDDMGRAVGEGE